MAHNKQHRSNPFVQPIFLAFAALLLIITTDAQTTSESAAVHSFESESAEKFLSTEFDFLDDFDLEDVGEHERPHEPLRNLKKGSKGILKKIFKSKSALKALYATTRLSANRHGYDTGFDEDACDEFWVENPNPTDEQMQSEQYVKICTFEHATGLAYSAAMVALIASTMAF